MREGLWLAPTRSLLVRSVRLAGRRLVSESTDHIRGIAPVPLWVRPETRRPGGNHRSPVIDDNLQKTMKMDKKGALRLRTHP